MSEDKKSFTVKDRRHFTPEGLAREAPAEPSGGEPGPDPQPQPRIEPAEDGGHAPDFTELLLSLAAQASLALGPDDEGGPDLPAGRHFISIFEMLKDKTEGRRTAEEDRVLDGILYQLRMAYLNRTRSGGQ